MNATLVQKFGGTSVADPDRIAHVARRVVAARQLDQPVAVVVSAMGHTTDQLLRLARQVTTEPSARELDMLMATGEQVSIALLTMAIQRLGHPAMSFTGAQAGVITERAHTKARIKDMQVERIRQALAGGNVAVVAGFQGITDDGEITTLGRGGSDTTAVALAAALDAPICEIFTDVDGVFTGDPRLVNHAQKLEELSYEEMMELASLGSQVLHPRSVECAQQNGIMIHVRSSFHNRPGTIVKDLHGLEQQRVVSGVTIDRNQAKVGLLDVPDRPGVAALLFGTLADAGINVDMIVQGAHQANTNDMAFTVKREDLGQAVDLTRAVARQIGARDVIAEGGIAKVSIVGAGMAGRAGVASTMFKALADAQINIQMISTSEIKISCIIEDNRGQDAMQVIHDRFELGQAPANLSGPTVSDYGQLPEGPTARVERHAGDTIATERSAQRP